MLRLTVKFSVNPSGAAVAGVQLGFGAFFSNAAICAARARWKAGRASQRALKASSRGSAGSTSVIVTQVPEDGAHHQVTHREAIFEPFAIAEALGPNRGGDVGAAAG